MLISFIEYCEEHPYERFWQALRNWAQINIDEKINFIVLAPIGWLEDRQLGNDTFYWENDKLKDVPQIRQDS